MNVFDLLALILENLGRRKGRVALTAVGVIIGTAAIVLLVSLAEGLQRNARTQLGGIGDLTRIDVYPLWQEQPMDPQGRPAASPYVRLITDDVLAEFAAIPHVTTVVPRDMLQGGGALRLGRLEGWAATYGMPLDDLSTLGLVAEQGTTALTRGFIVVGSEVDKNFFDPTPRPGNFGPMRPEEQELYDKVLRLTVTKWTSDGTASSKTLLLRVSGVLAQAGNDTDWSVYLPASQVIQLNEWTMGRRIDRKKDGYSEVIVKVDDVENVTDVAQAIRDMDMMVNSPQDYVAGVTGFFTIVQVIFGGMGAIALLVAAIGIANTMAMAILERTREIGVMKAVGATNRDVLSVFLGESAGIGFVGGLGGVLLGWTMAQLGNVVALAYFAGQASGGGGAPPPTVAVYTPVWLPGFALIFATLVGLLSGIYPALRAATLAPVTALKYE